MGSKNLHPYGCDGPGKCIHCDRREIDGHDPKTCELCDEGKIANPPIPLSKAAIILPEDGVIVVNEDGTIEGGTALRHCKGSVHVFENVPGNCQCGEESWRV